MEKLSEEIKGMTVLEFAIGMLQATHNRENPNHKCMCKSVTEMLELHFDKHKEDNQK